MFSRSDERKMIDFGRLSRQTSMQRKVIVFWVKISVDIVKFMVKMRATEKLFASIQEQGFP